MFGYVKNLLRKWVETPEDNPPARAVSAAPAPARRMVMAPPHAGAPAQKNGSHQIGRGIELPLQPLLDGLTLELQPRLKNPNAGALTIAIPLEKILAQISRGAVKITFGELRQAAPGLFTPEDDRDGESVAVPLGEILARLNPALITRRRVQKQVEVPAHISSPFDQRNQGLIFSIGPTKPESAPAPRQNTVPAPVLVAPAARSGLTFSPTPPRPAAAPPNTLPMSSATRALRALRSSHPPVPPAPAVQAAPTSPSPPPSSSAAIDPNPLLVSLTSLAEVWPEAVRQELVQWNLVEAKVALPAEIIERELKQGRVAFTWRTLRSWINPAPPPVVSAQDSLVLELPLKVVAPPFLARQKETSKLHRKVSVDEDIPNLFFGFPQPEASSPVVASPARSASGKAADTNFYVWDDASEQVQTQAGGAKLGSSPGTKFVAKYATPNEVVSRAAALDGVAGALISLPDGLMVASRISSDLNGDTLAAFLPQIFSKVNQCTKELRMGDLNNVHFTVGNIPWKIFRVNAIFFAVFGRAGEPLPTAQLAALASELNHRPK